MQVGVRTTFISCLDLLVWNYCTNHIKFMYTVQWNPWEKMTRWPQFWSIYNKQVRKGQQGWHSGESTCLPPVWLEFKSLCRRHMWVEFVVGSLPCSERFFSGFPSPQKPTLPNSNSIWNERTCLNEFIRTPKCFEGKQITIYDLQQAISEF